MTVLLATLLITGCATNGKLIESRVPNSCGSVGHTFTWIKYGDSHLGALAFSKIGRNAEWRFRLLPDHSSGPNAYTDALVTISGKTPADSWVSVSGQHSSNPVLILCVPEAIAINTDVNYMIDVQWVGKLDPRAKVVK
jgi:hypothetical protein